MRNLHLFILFTVLLVLTGCGDGKSVRQLPHLGDTPYQQDSVLVAYANNPERALTLLDSALLLGNVSDYRGQFIRAKIYSKSLMEQRQDSAIQICKALLSHDSVRNEPAEKENILTCSSPVVVLNTTMNSTCFGRLRRQKYVKSKVKRQNNGVQRPTSVM